MQCSDTCLLEVVFICLLVLPCACLVLVTSCIFILKNKKILFFVPPHPQAVGAWVVGDGCGCVPHLEYTCPRLGARRRPPAPGQSSSSSSSKCAPPDPVWNASEDYSRFLRLSSGIFENNLRNLRRNLTSRWAVLGGISGIYGPHATSGCSFFLNPQNQPPKCLQSFW